MIPVPRQSRAESPEVVLLAMEDQMDDQATWGLRLHGLPSSLFSHLQNGIIRFLPQELLCLYLMRFFALALISFGSVLGALIQLPPFRVPSDPESQGPNP